MTTLTTLIQNIKQHRWMVVGLMAGLVVVAFGAAAVRAAVPDANNIVHACYLTATGTVRVIDTASQNCTMFETATSWSAPTAGGFVTNMTGADLSGMDLRFRNFAGANLTGTTFMHTNLDGADFRGTNLSSANFSATLRHFNGTNFAGANLTDALFVGGVEVANANFSGANLTSVLVDFDAYMQESNLANADLGNSTLKGNFVNSNLTDADLAGATIDNANLAGANLTDAILTGTTWINTVCPDSTNSDNNGNTCAGHLVP